MALVGTNVQKRCSSERNSSTRRIIRMIGGAAIRRTSEKKRCVQIVWE